MTAGIGITLVSESGELGDESEANARPDRNRAKRIRIMGIGNKHLELEIAPGNGMGFIVRLSWLKSNQK